MRILKYKNIFVKPNVSNWAEKAFVLKRVKNTVSQIYKIYINLKGYDNSFKSLIDKKDIII